MRTKDRRHRLMVSTKHSIRTLLLNASATLVKGLVLVCDAQGVTYRAAHRDLLLVAAAGVAAARITALLGGILRTLAQIHHESTYVTTLLTVRHCVGEDGKTCSATFVYLSAAC